MTIEYIANEKINFTKLILIDENGNNLGERGKEEAIRIAYAKNLDLVLVSGTSPKATCKIMDLKKRIYNDKIELKKNRSIHKKPKLKEVRLSINTDTNDLMVKSKSIVKFLSQGSKVKISIKFPQRQRSSVKPYIDRTMNDILSYIPEEMSYELVDGNYSENYYFTEIFLNK